MIEAWDYVDLRLISIGILFIGMDFLQSMHVSRSYKRKCHVSYILVLVSICAPVGFYVS